MGAACATFDSGIAKRYTFGQAIKYAENTAFMISLQLFVAVVNIGTSVKHNRTPKMPTTLLRANVCLRIHLEMHPRSRQVWRSAKSEALAYTKTWKIDKQSRQLCRKTFEDQSILCIEKSVNKKCGTTGIMC